MNRFVLGIVVGLLALAWAGPAWSAGPTPGLVAAYAFDEGSGSVLTDTSGNARNGSIVGATWTTAGRYGGALSFNGTSDYVGLGGLGTFYSSGFTLEAWVQKQTATRNDVAVVGTWAGGQSGPMIWIDHLATRYQLTLTGGLSNYLDSGRNPVAGQWQHLAATYDGTTARFYIDGVEVASRTVAFGVGSSDVWRIGAYGASPGGFFDGLVDDVRIYDRAVSASEITTDMNTPLSLASASRPTTPGNLAVTTRTKTSLALAWTPSTSSAGISGYNVFLDGALVGATPGTTFAVGGLACSTTHELAVEAYDAAGNTSSQATEVASTELCAPPTGLVASYAFDAGSGTTLVDGSGNGHTGTIVGAAWATGRTGSALSFDGSSSHVDLDNLGTFYTGGFTLEAWTRKQTTKNDVAVVGTWTGSGGGPMIWDDHLASHYRLTLGTSMSSYLDSGRSPAAGRWQHVAATFDGTTARFFIDGVEVASRTAAGSVGSSSTWRIGAYGATPGGFFDGLIDDVRIYNRPLSAAEIQVDMGQPAPGPDTTAPTAPQSLVVTNPSLGRTALDWSAASDDRSVVSYAVHRSTTAGFAPSAANRIAQPTGTSYVDNGLATGTYFYKVTASDAAGNVGPASNEASISVVSDQTSPTTAITAPVAGALSGIVTVTANATDDQGVAGVQFLLDGRNLGQEDTVAPYAASWDTRGEINGAHALTALARDAAGNQTTATAVAVSISNSGASTVGLRAAYGFDDDTGSLVLDSSSNNRNATLVGATWSTDGHYGGAITLAGSASQIDLPALGTFYKAGFTYELWVEKNSARPDAGLLGTWLGSQSGGPMIWVDHLTGRYRLTLGTTFANYLDSGRSPAVGVWQHVAVTYDGLTARFYIDGAEVASSLFSGVVGDSNTWRIGAFGTPAGGFFDGLVDNVRIYDRALSSAEIQLDMVSRVQPDRVPPTVTAVTPSGGATSVGIGEPLSVKFSETMRASTVSSSTIELRDSTGTLIPTTLAYDTAANLATLTLQSALGFGANYTLTVKGGSSGVRDIAGNALAADSTTTFTTENGAPVLLVGTDADPFSSYPAEILRNEGLNAFTKADVRFLTPALLAGVDMVVLGQTPLTASQVALLTTWVNGGGKLIALRPDKQLAGLLGLTDTGTSLSNAYLQVDTSAAPGAGIAAATMQFHGTADQYALNGATAVATLFSTATAATTSPAVTLRAVGPSGGQAAAFTFDLARSVVYTRQGNPAWAGQERDGVPSLRSDDLFYGASATDPQPDWIDTSKIAIPQADEQQRLLANLITEMDRDRLPVPRFWYLPRGEKAVVVMSGDDHSATQANGGTAAQFDSFKALSPAGCVVASWQCVRSTSYIFATNPLTDAQLAAYVAAGFEIALHPVVKCIAGIPPTQAEVAAAFETQLAGLKATYPSLPAPVSSRNHCVVWPDWASVPKVELANGIRLDGNYYHYPASWIGTKPGFMNGGGFPMRFADTNGAQIDVYQQNTNITDESTSDFSGTLGALLDNALGAPGYYGAFGVNIHTDDPAELPNAESVVQTAIARGVPVISYKQMLDWVDGRNSSTFRNVGWSSGALTFTTTVAAGANGLQTMLPLEGPTGALSGITRSGLSVSYSIRLVKGVAYAVFTTTTGTYRATYS